ncbi:MAG: hypothetical protein QMB22_04255 [Dehalococcoidia bacterium]|jgi:hypothetical protein|nr:MAG: hypothetical protein DK305_000411 [Chloroflexota bacterium]|tara:strand:- start:8409 stop:8897 length:489 start_codon:yes stop_codon:yes gene_type:complete
MSRIDFVTGAPVRYAEQVSELAKLANDTKRYIPIQKKQSAADIHHDEAKWENHRIVCHMRNYAANINTLMKRMLIDTDPSQLIWNEQETYVNLNQSEKETLYIFNQFKSLVEEMVFMLSKTPDAAWGRAGKHVYLGRVSVKQLVKWHTNHIKQHIQQLKETE